MSITREDVEHIALLSRLYLDDEEIERYTKELGRILTYVDKINEPDTRDVPPTSHPIPLVNVLRADEIKPSLSNADALANAPDPEAPFFRVPRVVD